VVRKLVPACNGKLCEACRNVSLAIPRRKKKRRPYQLAVEKPGTLERGDAQFYTGKKSPRVVNSREVLLSL